MGVGVVKSFTQATATNFLVLTVDDRARLYSIGERVRVTKVMINGMAHLGESNHDWLSDGAHLDLAEEFDVRGLAHNASQIGLLEQIADAWVQETSMNVLPDGRNEMLWRCCTNAAQCWNHLEGEHDPDGKRGGITLPWVGPKYPQSRVALMGLNLVRSGGLLDEINITRDTINAFKNGERIVWEGSGQFQYRSSAMLSAVLAALDGKEIPDEPTESTMDLVEPVLRTARIQAVKCSPWGDGASPPSADMKRLCMPSLLPIEIEILKPKVLIVAHSEARGRLWYLAGKPKWDDRDHFTVGKATVNGHEFTILGVIHPSDRGGLWKDSWNQLVAYLREDGSALAAI